MARDSQRPQQDDTWQDEQQRHEQQLCRPEAVQGYQDGNER
jgi:hypothetical protein